MTGALGEERGNILRGIMVTVLGIFGFGRWHFVDSSYEEDPIEKKRLLVHEIVIKN